MIKIAFAKVKFFFSLSMKLRFPQKGIVLYEPKEFFWFLSTAQINVYLEPKPRLSRSWQILLGEPVKSGNDSKMIYFFLLNNPIKIDNRCMQKK